MDLLLKIFYCDAFNPLPNFLEVNSNTGLETDASTSLAKLSKPLNPANADILS